MATATKTQATFTMTLVLSEVEAKALVKALGNMTGDTAPVGDVYLALEDALD